MEKGRRCAICDIDVNRQSFAKRLRSKKTLGKFKTRSFGYTRLVNSRTY